MFKCNGYIFRIERIVLFPLLFRVDPFLERFGVKKRKYFPHVVSEKTSKDRVQMILILLLLNTACPVLANSVDQAN